MVYQHENSSKSYDFRSRHHDGFIIGAHIHEFSEIFYVKEGVADVYINGTHIIVKENHILFIPPNYIHEYKTSTAQVFCAVFSNDYIPVFFNTIGNRQIICTPIDISNEKEVIEKLYNLDTSSPLLISGYLSIILNAILNNSKFSAGEFSDGILYQQIVSYISRHYTENISLKSIAKRFGYNEKYLSFALHKLTGINVRKLISLYRINKAKELLSIPQKDVSEIALNCGFSAINTFNRVFKQLTGVTPSEFRKGA
ncbi:MAG: helix-turn-helix domain-containing protein [Clostridiales bacterium]|nr:helix-turn-helix domain-containing protein [Clostridiales bacterium]